MPDLETGERYDSDLLAEQLVGFDGDFSGTGWTADEFDALTNPDTTDPLSDEGDADTDDDLRERWGVIVECKTEAQQTRLLETLGAEGYDVRAIVS